MKTERFKTAIDTIYTWYADAVNADTIHPVDAVDELRLELEGLLTASMYLLSRSSYAKVRDYAEETYYEFESEVENYVNFQSA